MSRVFAAHPATASAPGPVDHTEPRPSVAWTGPYSISSLVTAAHSAPAPAYALCLGKFGHRRIPTPDLWQKPHSGNLGQRLQCRFVPDHLVSTDLQVRTTLIELRLLHEETTGGGPSAVGKSCWTEHINSVLKPLTPMIIPLLQPSCARPLQTLQMVSKWAMAISYAPSSTKANRKCQLRRPSAGLRRSSQSQ